MPSLALTRSPSSFGRSPCNPGRRPAEYHHPITRNISTLSGLPDLETSPLTGPSLSTLGRKPLYSAAKPSSFMTVPTAGQAQLYLGTAPATLGLFWIRDLTTSIGVFRIVPTVPPIEPAAMSLTICAFLSSTLGKSCLTWKMQPK